jgi:hypothetical protein
MNNKSYGFKRATTGISNKPAKRLISLGMYEFFSLELSNSGGHAGAMRAVRQATLDAAFLATPNRFKGINPCLAPMPTAVWINPPTPEVQTNTQHRTVNL